MKKINIYDLPKSGAGGAIPVLYGRNARHAATAAVETSIAMMRSRNAQVMEKVRRTQEDTASYESNIFKNVLYGHIVRKEFALHILREMALPRIKANPTVYRHAIKQMTRTVHREAVRWDSKIAVTMRLEGEEALERYDDLTEHVVSSRLQGLAETFYFTIMQVLTRNHCQDSALLAAVEVANYLLDFAERRLVVEIEAYESESPLVVRLTNLSCPELHHWLGTLRDALAARLLPREAEFFDMNQDKNASQACRNLMQWLIDAHSINSIVDPEWVARTAREYGLEE